MQKAFKILLMSFCIAVMSLAVAQDITVNGTVLNEATGVPITGLKVYLIDAVGLRLPSDERTVEDERTADNVTDLEGHFAILNVIPNTWYGIEIYVNDTLLFKDYIFTDGNSDDPVKIKLGF